MNSRSLYWEQRKWDQQKFILIFLLKLCLFFASNFKANEILRATVSKETLGFDI